MQELQVNLRELPVDIQELLVNHTHTAGQYIELAGQYTGMISQCTENVVNTQELITVDPGCAVWHHFNIPRVQATTVPSRPTVTYVSFCGMIAMEDT